MCFWWKSCLLVFYALIMIYSSYLFEWCLLLESGYTSYQIIQPLQNLSITQLQLLLENRGIPDAALVEKNEIVDVLQYSGPVQYMELLIASDSEKIISNSPLEITGRDEFYEQVSEDSESVWLIEVVPEESLYTGHRLFDDASWKKLNAKLIPVGIKTAVIKCHKEPKLCSKQGWVQPQVVLSIPRPGIGSHLIQLPSIFQRSLKSVLNWVHGELYDFVYKIKNVCELEAIWLNSTQADQEKVPKMIYVSELVSPPLLLITLGLRFSSRFKFAVYIVGANDRDQVSKALEKQAISGPPALVITSSESISSYGYEKGEIFSLNALEIYTKLLRPKMNDVFMASLFLANFLVLIDFLDVRGRTILNHFGRTFFSIPAYNAVLLFLWLILTSAIKFPWMSLILNCSVLITQMVPVSGGNLFGFIIYHFLILQYFIVAIVAMFLAGAMIIFVWRRYLGGNQFLPNEDSDNDGWYTIFPLDSYLVNALFRPMTSLSRPRPSHDLGLEEGMEMLIERLATPNLWLHPAISTDYIKDLPTWRYDGWGNEEDLKSESETDWDSLSETENQRLLESHTCCEDELCKMCTLWATVKETYVCHRCAILKRKFEKQYLRYRGQGDGTSQNTTYQKLLNVCSNCTRTRKNNPPKETKSVGLWLSRQKVTELQWTAPGYAIETRLCAICLDRYRWSAVLCGLPCGHTYHHSCVMEWLSKDNHHCPTCRWPSYKAKLNSATK